MTNYRFISSFLIAWTIVGTIGTSSFAQDESELAKKTQNPVADLISVPFQNNFNFGVGEDEDMQCILNIQPVVPFSLTIVPIIDQPDVAPGVEGEFGLGDIQEQIFFSPAAAKGLIWGVGPVLQFPTATDDILGADKWAAGPGAVVLHMAGPWVIGALANNIWSFAGDDDRSDLNQMLLQPFLNYNLPRGWYLTSAPVMTANWEADDDNTWTVPVGGGAGKIFRLGKLPLNGQLAAFYNVERPDGGTEWSLRAQLQFLFPKL